MGYIDFGCLLKGSNMNDIIFFIYNLNMKVFMNLDFYFFLLFRKVRKGKVIKDCIRK